MNWIDSHSPVDKGVTVRSCMINGLLYADDLVLLAPSERLFNMHLTGFHLRTTNRE